MAGAAPGMGCSRVFARRDSRLIYPRPLLGGSLVLSVKMEVLGEEPLAAYSELVSWCTGGFCVEGVSWSIKVRCAEEQAQLPPVPAQILESAHKFSQT